MNWPASLREQLADWCHHFTGIQHDRCKLGIAYKDVKGPQGVPCLKGNRCSERCASASFPSLEEVEQEAKHIEEHVKQYLERGNQ